MKRFSFTLLALLVLLCTVTAACSGNPRRSQGARDADRESATTQAADTASRQGSSKAEAAVPPAAPQPTSRDSAREKEKARVQKALEEQGKLKDHILEGLGGDSPDVWTQEKLKEIKDKKDSLQRILKSYAPIEQTPVDEPGNAEAGGEDAAGAPEFDADRHAQNEVEALRADVRNVSLALYALVALLILTWAALILLFVTRPSKKAIFDELRNRLRRLQSETGSQLQGAASQQGRQQGAIQQLQAEVAALKQALARTPSVAAPAPPTVQQPLQPGGAVSKPRLTQIFMKQPAAGGYFDATTQLSVPDQAIYILTPDADGLHAAYSFSPSDRSDLRRALDNPQTYIDPVCQRKDDTAVPGQRTYTCSPGRLRRDGNRWVVEEKAFVTIFR